jgi:hypothetical protein
VESTNLLAGLSIVILFVVVLLLILLLVVVLRPRLGIDEIAAKMETEMMGGFRGSRENRTTRTTTTMRTSRNEYVPKYNPVAGN